MFKLNFPIKRSYKNQICIMMNFCVFANRRQTIFLSLGLHVNDLMVTTFDKKYFLKTV